MTTQDKHVSPTPLVPPTIKGNAAKYKLLIFVGIAAVVVIAAGLTVAVAFNRPTSVPQLIGAPQATISTTLIDHGDVQMDEFAESVFVVRNTGDQPLNILDEPRVELVQGCCPPRAIVSRSTIQPGEEATISLRFTMHEMMGGPHEFRVHVHTNDPAQPQITLTILSNWVE